MVKEVVIFDANSSPKSGSFYVSKRPKPFRITRFLAILFLTISLTGIILFFLPIVTAELQYQLHSFQRHALRKQDELFRSKFSFILSPDESQFELIIPKIGIKTQVLANVDPANEQEYDKILKDKAAHAMGSKLPGEEGLVYIFAHSADSIFDLSRYNPVFYLLKELNPNDEIGIIHQGKVHLYRIAEKKVVEAKNLADVEADSNQEKLILQTCWPPGTDWKRLLVIAYPEIVE